MRRFFSKVLCFAIIFSMCGILPIDIKCVNAAVENNINIILNGSNLVFDQPPIIENNRTLVPMRAIFEAMGATIVWNEQTQSVFAEKGNLNFKLQIGSNIAYKNDTEITLDVTKKEEQQVKLSAKNLYETLVENKNSLLIVDWYKDDQPKLKVQSIIQDVLDKTLPQSYGRIVFKEKLEVVFNHIVDRAMTGYGYVAS